MPVRVSAVSIAASRSVAVAVMAALTITSRLAPIAPGSITGVLTGSLPLAATGGLFYIVPSLMTLVPAGNPAMRQRRLVGRRVVRRRTIVARWRRR
jgi:hypothetical protein